MISYLARVEEYILYAQKAAAQINSHFETSQLIGVIRLYCWQNNIPVFSRPAARAKPRWTDEILVHKGILSEEDVVNGYSPHIKDSIRLIPNLLSVPLSLFNFIFSYLDIFTIGKVGLCSKELYNLIYKHYAFNMFTARCYTNSIFLNSHLYKLNLPLLKKQFKSNYDMFKGKNRIRYGGLYYCKVKYIKEVQIYGEEFNKNVLVQYYRVLRFLPNGEVHMMTTPYFKVNKIKNGIKNGSIELKVGTFRVDENEQIILNIGESDEYIYKFGWNDIRRYRAGYSKGDIGVIRGFELVKYNIIRGNQRTEIIINDKFPIAFRFRPIEKLINELGFVCIKEEEDEAIR